VKIQLLPTHRRDFFKRRPAGERRGERGEREREREERERERGERGEREEREREKAPHLSAGTPRLARPGPGGRAPFAPVRPGAAPPGSALTLCCGGTAAARPGKRVPFSARPEAPSPSSLPLFFQRRFKKNPDRRFLKAPPAPSASYHSPEPIPRPAAAGLSHGPAVAAAAAAAAAAQGGREGGGGGGGGGGEGGSWRPGGAEGRREGNF
jgi:translation initiation factor IF-2